MGLDGPTLDRPDTPENARPFGRPTTGRAAGAFPRSGCGPRLDHRGPGDLRIGDRGCFGSTRIRSVVRRGAHRRARVKSNTGLRPIRPLLDGSARAKVSPSEADRRRDRRGLAVRVIESSHDDPNRPGAGERHRLITALVNPEDRPASEAPRVDPERWGQERACDAIKTDRKGRAVPLRSQTPAGVVPESDGLALAQDVGRRVRPDAAVGARPAPDRLSVLASLRVLRCQWPESPAVRTETWDQRLRREVRRPRRNRW